jgi:hypothetical protein
MSLTRVRMYLRARTTGRLSDSHTHEFSASLRIPDVRSLHTNFSRRARHTFLHEAIIPPSIILWSRQPRLNSFVMDSPKEQQKNDRSKCYEKIIHDIMTRTEQSSYLSTNSTIPSRDDDPRSNKSTSPGERLSRRRMSTDKVPFKSDCRFP